MIFEQINQLGSRRIPFFFMISFDGSEAVVLPLTDLAAHGIAVSFHGQPYGLEVQPVATAPCAVSTKPVSASTYRKGFACVQGGIQAGNSYLLNLTFPTDVTTDYTLEDIYLAAEAAYKVYWKDRLVFFSPEAFVRIADNRISSFPMKGTIDAALPDALQQLIDSRKELYEHYTIVDLIRNDLAMVADRVVVDRFRYHEKIATASGREIYQTSSEISGTLSPSWPDQLGTLLQRLLPAGSISGAPKAKTLEIIREAEIDNRGFYSGVTGIFDGTSLTSCVNIRFLEQLCPGHYRYRSGGGITCNSQCEEEYNELITKVYVPRLY